MKFVTILHKNTERVGVVNGTTISLLPLEMGDLVTIIQAGPSMNGAIQELVNSNPESIQLEGAQILAPIRRFSKNILCTGWNYWAHFEEGHGKREGQDVDAPKHPTFFTKAPDVVIGPYDPICFDTQISNKWDWEIELVVIFGRDGRNIPEDKAMEHVFGFCLANDISQRDLQRAHGGQWFKGKSIDDTMPLGPWVVTSDTFDASDVVLECEVNGERKQYASTKQMAFTIPRLIAELTQGLTIRAGDILLTGTPAGVGNAMEPPQFLKANDYVIGRGAGLGELRNKMKSTNLHSYQNGTQPS